MIKKLKYILFALLIISCKKGDIGRPKMPDNLINKDSMVEIIYDISLINSAKGVNKKLIESKGIIPQDYIYKKHNIDSLQFTLSNEHYAYDLKTYENIYNNVKSKLEKDKDHFQTIIDAEQKVKDSLNKIKRKQDSLKKSKLKKEKVRKRDSILQSPIKKTDKSEISTH